MAKQLFTILISDDQRLAIMHALHRAQPQGVYKTQDDDIGMLYDMFKALPIDSPDDADQINSFVH